LSKLKKRSLVAAAAALGALALAVSAFGGPSRQAASANVSVTAGKPSELRFTLAPKSVAKGAVVFKVSNKGKLQHDFKISGKKTPKLAAGKKATLSVTFKRAGRYPYLCTVPGHAAGGMKGVLVVR
jgi:uncharacterized cupredoxin-like copper-binding protein